MTTETGRFNVVLAQLDDLIKLAEALIPANPASEENERWEKRYSKVMASYFRSLENAFPYDKLAEIYYKYVKTTEANLREADPFDAVEESMSPLLRMFRTRLMTDLIGQHVSAYLAGSAEIITWGKTRGGIPIQYEGPPIRQAIDYAREHCAKLVTKMDDESKQLIADTVSDAIDNKRGIDGLTRDIKAQFDDMTTHRADMIARTESCDALQQAYMDTTKAMGINGKEWVVTEPCEICEENGAEGAIGIDDEFPSGHLRPPAHPNCRCALAPVMLSAEESLRESPPVGHEPYNLAHDEKGRFGSGGGGGSSASLKAASSHKDLPQHIQDLNPPPAWTDLRYNEDPSGDLLLVGKDAAGRDQYVYSERFSQMRAAEKFERVQALSENQDTIARQMAADMDSDNPKTREAATCLELVRQTGIRPGSLDDTGAKVQAFGATTLEGRHVMVEGESVRLQFTGKKGVDLDIEVSDKALAGELIIRKSAVGDNERIFNVDDRDLRDYSDKLDGGGFHPKDFRTLVGTSTASQIVASMPRPSNSKEYRQAVRDVAKQVSAKLGNTPTVALQSYISPTVFSGWR